MLHQSLSNPACQGDGEWYIGPVRFDARFEFSDSTHPFEPENLPLIASA
jgi:hypothetical protein